MVCDPAVRADAAANRRRILDAARELVTEYGASGLTMRAVAAGAGVGKSTVFHRFGDRDGLARALVDDYMRELQDRFLHGPPPLGPGAPPQQRLEVFMAELVACQYQHLELALAAESTAYERFQPVYAALLIHIMVLLEAINPALDAHIIGGYLLGAVAPPVLQRIGSTGKAEREDLQRGIVDLVRGLLARPEATGGAPGRI